MLVILAVLLLRYFRPHWEARKGRVIIRYDTGRKIETITGRSILDISLNHQHPHANVCGGKGRCSTCRIRIMGDISKLPPPSPEESKILKRIKASHDIRLACQCMPPPGEYLVSCLMPVETKIQDVHARKVNERGKESEIIILFADLRGFTKLSEEKLPYDVVFILNRFFAMMGEAVEKNNGHLDKFLGDGVMAIFGLERSPSLAARDAIQSAKDMIDGIETLNHTLAAELPHPLKIGIGIHAGPAIIGDMGYGKATHFTAIGDTVNTASRLESLTKDLEAAILISERVIHHSSIDVVHLESIETPLRGKKQTLRVYPIKDSRNITL